MTSDFKSLCVELIEAVLADDSRIDSVEIARRARAVLAGAGPPTGGPPINAEEHAILLAAMAEARADLAEPWPEPKSQALADLAWSDTTTIAPSSASINGRIYRLIPMAEPEPPADGEVAELVALIREVALVWDPTAPRARQLARAADLLERLAVPESTTSEDD